MEPGPQLDKIKANTKAAWMAGDYTKFAEPLESEGLRILDGLGIPAGCRMLDVACGSGQAAIPAARAGVEVTGIDIATNLIEAARQRVAAEGLSAKFDEGDMEQLPYPAASFDVVLSTFGAIWSIRPDRVSTELIRVCRPGGRIILLSWVRTGMMGQLLTKASAWSPPSIPSPLLWGDEEVVRARLADHIKEIRFAHKMFRMRYPFGPRDVADNWLRYNGPLNLRFDSLPAEEQIPFRAELERFFAVNNLATDGTGQFDSEYLETTAIRE